MQQPTNPGGGATSELRADAKDLGSKAASRLHSEVDNRKGAAVSQAQSVSSAIEKTADSLDDSAPQWLKSAFQQGATKIQQFADTIDQKDSREILSEVQSFARERPGLFLGACAAAGFAAARIFKAGGEPQVNEGASFDQSGSSETKDSSAQLRPYSDPGAARSPQTIGSTSSSKGEFV